MSSSLQMPSPSRANAAHVPAAAMAAGPTLAVVERIDLSATPAKVWNVIKDFADWHLWHPALAGTAITAGGGNAIGTVRVLTTRDGATFTEELLAHDGATRSYRYSFIESPLPVADYVATIEVQARGAGARVVWSSIFDLAAGASESEVKAVVSGIYRAGLDRLPALVR